MRHAIASSVLAVSLVWASSALADDCALKQMASLEMVQVGEAGVSVPVLVNGSPEVFTIDTAGVFSALSERAARDLRIETVPLGHEIYSAASGRSSEVYDSSGHKFTNGAIVESLKIGNNEAKHLHMLVMPESSQSPVAGTIGPELLELFDLDLDFAGGRSISSRRIIVQGKSCTGRATTSKFPSPRRRPARSNLP